MKWLVTCYWILWCIGTLGLCADGWSFPWQAMLVIAWLMIWRFRSSIRMFLRKRVRMRSPTSPERQPEFYAAPVSLRYSPPLWVWYFGMGLFYTAVIGENLGTGFEGDIHPNLAINTLLWAGCYMGLLAGWWLLGRTYLWTPWQVYWLSGLMGVIIEQDYLIPRMLAGGQGIQAVVLTPFVHAVYGSMIAPVFAILGRDLPVGDKRPGIGAAILALVLPAAFFFLGVSWVFLWFWLVPSWRV